MSKLDEKISLLSKPVWSYRDIMDYFDHIKSSTTAIELKKKIQAKGGGVKYDSRLVKTDAVLEHYGLSRENELNTLTKAKKNEEELQERKV